MLPPDNQFDLAEANWPGITAYLDSTSSRKPPAATSKLAPCYWRHR